MSKFNKFAKQRPDTVNVAGAPAYARTNTQQELVSIVLNSMLKGDSYYETEQARIANIVQLTMLEPSSEFLMKLYVYTRTVFNLRSVSHILAVALLTKIKGDADLRIALQMAMVRPDDATEIVALWNITQESMIPNALRKAIKHNLEHKWDAYQLKKYFGNGKVKVSDLIKLTHPNPHATDNAGMFLQALNGELPNIETAQTVNASSTGGDRAETYINMMVEGKLGVMAALKNINKMFSAGSEYTNQALSELEKLLTNKYKVEKSRVLPFRFAQAYEAIYTDTTIDGFTRNRILEIIDFGFANSAVNLELVEEGQTVALLLDESGSMGSGDGSPFYQGKVMTASLLAGLPSASAVGFLWADTTRQVGFSTPMKFVQETHTQGMSTNLGQAIDALITQKFMADVVIVLTDMQENQIGGYYSNSGSFDEMRKRYLKLSPKTKFIFWNLNGYGGGTPMKLQNNVLEVVGFSERMLKLIPLMLKDKDGIIKDIMAL